MDKRLEKISILAEGSSAIDIGSDHGYLLIKLYNKGFKKLLAIEKNEGPLDNCISNLQKEKLENKIEVKLSDGLQNLSKEKIRKYENIIIAGMGGSLIKSIIHQDILKFQKGYLILQPNNAEDKLREFLNKNNFEILVEEIVKENKKYYEIIKVKYQKDNKQVLTKEQLMFGIKQDYNTIHFKSKWEEEEKHLQNLIKELKQKGIKPNEKINNKIKMIQKRRNNGSKRYSE